MNYDNTELFTKAIHGNVHGNLVGYKGTVNTPVGLAAADKVRLCKVPAGVDINSVTLNNTAIGATVTGQLQLEPTDGTAATIYVASATGLATAQPNGVMYAPVGFKTTKESYLVLLINSMTTPAAGTVNAVLEGILEGVK